MTCASFGKCSPIMMLGTDVSIGLNCPPLAWPGFKSNVSVWLGPPDIHSKMHARLRAGCAAASAASAGNHREDEKPNAPSDARRRKSRRLCNDSDRGER